ncbi:N-acetylated-alpha-linked acidic dipeptidase-like protein [Plakobranchus ocellatus]|uniref:N-acetylated-alpha-linked acidic dipeptidase-like protein n=1 Tax=Plakobranchus ocellatus TaxID=259542 RepID=A0AAV3Y8X1_9GAST|nr:N-acetylated-alpha-linked acidic dipeptidase-like protein [Plakobranchus ocellatus]
MGYKDRKTCPEEPATRLCIITGFQKAEITEAVTLLSPTQTMPAIFITVLFLLSVNSPSVVFALLAHQGLAYQTFQNQIPNGNNVPHPCLANYMWPGVGHENRLGGGVRNPFGQDFARMGYRWSSQLCQADSDGDGRTNGDELGDPNCVWTVGQIPARVSDITHPVIVIIFFNITWFGFCIENPHLGSGV